MLVGHLEQLAVELAIERCIREQKDRGAGVDDAVGVFPKIVGRLPNHGHATEILTNLLDARESAFQQLLVLHVREDLLDHDMLGNTKIL